MVCLIAFLDEPGAGGERPRDRERPERVPFNRVQGLPEDNRGGITPTWHLEFVGLRILSLVPM